jgi:RNase H-fold protein (predicted Holliday junction resolvase)
MWHHIGNLCSIVRLTAVNSYSSRCGLAQREKQISGRCILESKQTRNDQNEQKLEAPTVIIGIEQIRTIVVGLSCNLNVNHL